MEDLLLGPWAKSLPPSAWGMTRRELLAERPRLSEFATPLLTIDRSATRHNIRLMGDWLDERGLRIAPHGKTTMAPQLWRELLDAGAWGITVATPWQAQVARANGIDRIVLANEVADPVGLRWIAAELAEPAFEVTCWVDSVAGVELLRAGLERAARPLDVVVELGAPGGRTGARSVDAALEVVAAVERAPELRLAGVGGYEGSYANDRDAASVARVRSWLDGLVTLHERVRWDARPLVTAGGSAFFDLVGEALAPLVGEADVVLRSGAYQLHDDGFYRGVTPLPGLRSAMHGWARVLSRPEPGLALLDGGKRDFPYDLGMPTTPLGTIDRLNDQHAYLRTPGEAPAIGDVVQLGLSHPCTAFDKWRLIPVVESLDGDDPVVVDLVRTWF